jgi:hypothetical protein
MLNPLLPAATLLLLWPATAFPVPGQVSLKDLVSTSDTIVVGTVSRVLKVEGVLVAEVEVERTLKGGLRPRQYFLASPRWGCDIAEAVAGERALLFLVNVPDALYAHLPTGFAAAYGKLDTGTAISRLADSGRGRMPVRSVKGIDYVTVWTDSVEIADGMTAVPGPIPEAWFIISVDMSQMLDAVREGLVPPR